MPERALEIVDAFELGDYRYLPSTRASCCAALVAATRPGRLSRTLFSCPPRTPSGGSSRSGWLGYDRTLSSTRTSASPKRLSGTEPGRHEDALGPRSRRDAPALRGRRWRLERTCGAAGDGPCVRWGGVGRDPRRAGLGRIPNHHDGQPGSRWLHVAEPDLHDFGDGRRRNGRPARGVRPEGARRRRLAGRGDRAGDRAPAPSAGGRARAAFHDRGTRSRPTSPSPVTWDRWERPGDIEPGSGSRG